MKKILALILALSMALSLGVTAFAATTTKTGDLNFTLTPPALGEGHDYTVNPGTADAGKIDMDYSAVYWYYNYSPVTSYSDITESYPMESAEKFCPEYYYYVVIMLNPTDDYHFDPADTYTINGETAGTNFFDPSYEMVIYKSMGYFERPVCDKVVVDFTEPVAGANPVFNYTIKSPSNISDPEGTGKWYELEDASKLSDFYDEWWMYDANKLEASDTFTEGKVQIFFIENKGIANPYEVFSSDVLVKSTKGKVGKAIECVNDSVLFATLNDEAPATAEYESVTTWGDINIIFVFDGEEEEKGGFEIISRGKPTKGYKEDAPDEYATPLPDTRKSAPTPAEEANPNTGVALSIAPLALLAFAFKKRK